MVINKELDSTNLPPLLTDLSRQGPQYLPSLTRSVNWFQIESFMTLVLEDVFLTVLDIAIGNRSVTWIAICLTCKLLFFTQLEN